MKRRIIRLTESDLSRIVKKTLKEMYFDDDFIKFHRKGKKYSDEEFRPVPKNVSFDDLEDDSTTPERFLHNQIDREFTELLRRMHDRKRRGGKRKDDDENED